MLRYPRPAVLLALSGGLLACEGTPGADLTSPTDAGTGRDVTEAPPSIDLDTGRLDAAPADALPEVPVWPADVGPDAPPPDAPLAAIEDVAWRPLDGPPSPDAGPPPPDAAVSPPPIWFVHLSDTHVGDSPTAGQALVAYFEQILPVIDPVSTLHTGDLVELGSDLAQWTEYDTVTVGRVPAYPEWVEIPGNHDVKEDGQPNYEAHAHTVLAGAGLFGETLLAPPAGRVRLIRTDTADTTWNPVNLLGYFGEEQANALLALPEPDPPPVLTLVLGHHPMTGLERLFLLGSDRRMHQIFDRFRPQAYLCGHIHIPAVSWIGTTIQIQAGALGKANLGSPSFMLVAYDDGVLSTRSIGLDVEDPPPVTWPLVLTTAPVNAGLGWTNPNAPPVAPGAPVAVRALVFSPEPVGYVDAWFDEEPTVALEPGVVPAQWRGELTAPLEPGVHVLKVGSGNGEPDRIAVQVAAP